MKNTDFHKIHDLLSILMHLVSFVKLSLDFYQYSSIQILYSVSATANEQFSKQSNYCIKHKKCECMVHGMTSELDWSLNVW